jgi:signal transduction histidine kinase
LRKSTNLEIPVINRKKIKELGRQLEDSGVPNAAETAEYLVDLGISESLPELSALLVTERNTDILSFAAEPIISRRMAEIVDVASHKAANVVSALRSYLTTEVNEASRVVDVDRDIEQVLVLMNNMLKHGIEVHCEFSGVRVLGSQDKLAQVWLNLIRNAAQAMDFKGSLTVRTEQKEGWAVISVIDSGPGIPEAIMDKIFEPFFTTKKEGEGMGLGLDLCRRIIGTYQGTISVTSLPGFTEFSVRLPAVEGIKNND